MPTLVRLLSALIVIAALIVASMAMLVLYVEPKPHPVTQTVPLKALGQGPGQEAGQGDNETAPAQRP